MRRRLATGGACAAAALLCAAPAIAGGIEPMPAPAMLDPQALALLGEAARQAGEPDVLVAPAGIRAVLAMLREGARGETAAGLDRYLGRFAGGEPGSAAPDPETLRSANSVWVREGFTPRREFVDAVSGRHRGEVRSLDFGSPDAPRAVNAWARDATGGRIPAAVGEIASTTRLLLVNAMHFKAAWQTPFDSTRSVEGEFTAASGKAGRATFMSQAGRFPYAETGEYQAVELPYRGGRYAMLLCLPAKGRRLEAWLAPPEGARRSGGSEGLAPRQGTVELPRFQLEFGASLAAPLRRLGLAEAFDPARADLAGIADGAERLYLEDLVQKAVLVVDERGTEAAAATVGLVGVTSADPAPPFVFRADRPFLCAVLDRANGEVLFIAAVGAAGTR